MKLFELERKIFYETQHERLYHLCDHHGFAYTIDQNALKSLQYDGISTTTNPDMNAVPGKSHMDFKFILDGKPLIKNYGGFDYDHMVREIGSSGDSRMVSLNESEIRLNTREVKPFAQYLIGTVLLFNLFSRTGIQWLLYNNKQSNGMFDYAKSEAPRAIEALYQHTMIWKKPIWVSPKMRRPSSKEVSFLKDAFRIHKSGGNFNDGMLKLCDKYNIVDHFGKPLDRATVERLEKSRTIYTAYNEYYQKRRVLDVDPKIVRSLFLQALDEIDINSNIRAIVLGELERRNLFDPIVAPVDWAIIIKPLMYGDVEECLDCIEYVADKTNRQRRAFFSDGDDDVAKYAVHSGTRF